MGGKLGGIQNGVDQEEIGQCSVEMMKKTSDVISATDKVYT